MKAVYGGNGFWSWLRYWYIDTENYITWMLLDKSYYDYDYEAAKEKRRLTEEDKKLWSQEKLNAILGVGPKKTLTPEELQTEVMRDKEADKEE